VKKGLSVAILALLMVSLVAGGCKLHVPEEIELPEGPYPAPPRKWSRTFGGPHWDRAYSVQQTTDGGFIIAGATPLDPPLREAWLVKTDPQGNEEWRRTFGGVDARSVQQTADGGFVFVGRKGRDFGLVKADPQGNKEWWRTYRGDGAGWALSVWQTACGGFVIAGSIGYRTPRTVLSFWLVRTDPEGRVEWMYPVGRRRGFSTATSIKQTACGGFIIAGTSDAGGDVWLLKLAPER
jgi:hypothetical protein